MKNDFGKIPPNAIQIEESLLGALMIEPEYFTQICSIIKEDSFYSPKNQIVFKTMISLNLESKPIDLMMVTNRLKETSKLEEIGGIMAITELSAKAPYAANIEQYARIIADKYAKREAIRIATELLNEAYDDSIDIENVITSFQQAGLELEKHFDSVDSGSSSMEVAKETIQEIFSDVEKNRKGIPSGITTGFSNLDRMLGGFKPATFVILAARPGIGKTSIALHFAISAAFNGKHVNFFSFEMTKTQLFKILIAGESQIDRTKIRDGKLSDDELNTINLATGNIDHLPITWNTRRMNVHQIRSVVRKNYKKNRCDLVIIDYLQLINPSESKSVREQQISEISRELKLMTVEFGIPIIALSQLNRLAETEVPQLRHLRESGALEQDADNVIFPFKEVDQQQNELSYSLIVAKARNGSTGTFEIWHNDQMTRFGNKDDGRFEDVNNFNVYNPNSTLEPGNLEDEPF